MLLAPYVAAHGMEGVSNGQFSNTVLQFILQYGFHDCCRQKLSRPDKIKINKLFTDVSLTEKFNQPSFL